MNSLSLSLFPLPACVFYTLHVEPEAFSADRAIANKNNNNNSSGFSAQEWRTEPSPSLCVCVCVCICVCVSARGQKKNGQTETMALNTIYIVLSCMGPERAATVGAETSPGGVCVCVWVSACVCVCGRVCMGEWESEQVKRKNERR